MRYNNNLKKYSDIIIIRNYIDYKIKLAKYF